MSLKDENVNISSLKPKIELFKQCIPMYSHLKHMHVRNDEVIIQLPEQLHAKYIIKSITYLADEWLTLNTAIVEAGDSERKLIIHLDKLDEDRIANLCAELNECIDHFIARATKTTDTTDSTD